MPFRVAVKCARCSQRHTVYIAGEKLPPEKTRLKYNCPFFKRVEDFTTTLLPKGELAFSIPPDGIVGTVMS